MFGSCFQTDLYFVIFCWLYFFIKFSLTSANFVNEPSQFFHEVIKKETVLLEKPWQYIDLTRIGYEDGRVSPKCMTYLEDFSNATSVFIDCAVTNARPLHYCQNCVSQYLSVKYIFGLIINDTSELKLNCREQILRADTIQLAFLTYKFVENIWETSHCDRCFNITYNNATVSYDETKMTKTLLRKINVTLECFQDFSNLTNDTNFNASVCDNCNNFYSEANDYYEIVEDEGMLCSDLIDSMNYTRLAWAGTYNCTIAKEDKGMIWVITAIVCLLPVILYLGIILYDRKISVVGINQGFQEFQEAT